MSFATPALLWALLLIPFLAAAYLLAQRRRIKYAARFTNLDLLTNVVDASPGRRRHLPPALAIAALAALLLAMARPQTVEAVPREEASVVLAMDSSASMTATDVEPTRFDAAKSAASSFLDDLPERFKVGLVSFASSASVLQEPTDDRESVRESLNALDSDLGTAVGDAILRSVELAPEGSGSSTTDDERAFSVLLLSDGASTTGSDPMDAVEVAKEAGVPIYTIALGTDSGTVDVTDEFGNSQTYAVPPDPETLKQIAEETGGQFFEAPTEADLQAVYDELGSQVGFEKKERELSAPFAGAGAALLLLGGTLSVLWFGRIP